MEWRARKSTTETMKFETTEKGEHWGAFLVEAGVSAQQEWGMALTRRFR